MAAWGKGTIEQTFGERVRALRFEAGFEKQAALARLIPANNKAGHRHLSWVSKIENGEQEPSIADLGALARALGVSTDLLVYGEEAPESEFVDRLRGMEPQLDERGKRAVLATAEREVEEAKTASADAITQSLIDAGFDPEAARRAVEAMRQTAVDPGEVAAGA